MGLRNDSKKPKDAPWKHHQGPFKVIRLKPNEGLETPTIQFNKLDLWKDHNV